jgi:adenylate cyclase
MGVKELKDAVSEEVATILASDFQVDVTATRIVPHSNDPAITFPNLDDKRQGAKLIDTCVLYIDIRRSTELNLTHKPRTVARLYSAFVRAMTRCATEHNGHVRGIIGDRVMVLFDQENAFVNAVNCAISMNSVSQYVINKHFTRGEVACGIGVDSGKMLATKTGMRRRGINQHAYRNLVWLGRPANIASKLTDLANKPKDSFQTPMVQAAFSPSLLGGAGTGPLGWVWRKFWPGEFVRQLTRSRHFRGLEHSNVLFEDLIVSEEEYVRRPATKPILVTERVWDGFRAAAPTDPSVTGGWFRPVNIAVPGYDGKVFEADVIYVAFRGS